MGFPTFINPVSLQFNDFEPNMHRILALCNEFGLSTTLTPNLPTELVCTTVSASTAGGNVFTLSQIDSHVAHRIRENLDAQHPITGRPLLRSPRHFTLYQELIGLAIRYGLDLNHMHSRRNPQEPLQAALPNPSDSHAASIGEAIQQRVFARWEPQAPIVFQETELGPYQHVRSIPKSSYKASVKSPSEEVSLRVTKVTYRDKAMMLGFNKLSSTFPFYINQTIKLTGFQPDSYNGSHTIASIKNESHLPISTITVAIDNLPERGPVTKRGSIIYDAKIPIFPTCAEMLSNISSPFKRTANKLKLICNSFSKQCTSLDREKLYLWRELSEYPTSRTRTVKANPEYCIPSLFKLWKAQSPRERATYMLLDKDLLYIEYEGQMGEGDGVRRSFIQRVLDEFIIHKIFVPSTGESSERHFINPEFDPSKAFKKACGMQFVSEEEYVIFYEFIGRLLGFVLMNDVGLSFHLSHSILAHMIYKHEDITNDDYLAYGLFDFQDEFRSYINLMRQPEHIEYAYLSFNSDYDLRSTDDDVDVSSFGDYIREKCKYRMLHKVFSKEQKPNAVDVYPRFKGMVKGFSTLRKFFGTLKLTVPTLDKLLTFGTVSLTTVLDLIENFERNMAGNYVETTANMVSILRDNGETFPYDVIGIERPRSQTERRKYFLQFIERLLMFWSSYKRYCDSLGYFLIVKHVEEFDAAKRVTRNADASKRRALTENERKNMLPESHTCFARIDIPDTYKNDRDLMYRKLVQCAYFMEAGISNLGGARSLSSVRRVRRSRRA